MPLNRNHVFDSNGPDMRLRGTAAAALREIPPARPRRDQRGDRVMAEGYFQHAEHYFRILNAMSQAQQQREGGQQAPQRRYQQGGEQNDGGEGNGGEPSPR